MQYVGIQTQQSRNNARSAFLLFLFPCLVGVLSYLFCYLLVILTQEQYMNYSRMDMVNEIFLQSIPYIIGGVTIWFLIAYFANTSIIKDQLQRQRGGGFDRLSQPPVFQPDF